VKIYVHATRRRSASAPIDRPGHRGGSRRRGAPSSSSATARAAFCGSKPLSRSTWRQKTAWPTAVQSQDVAGLFDAHFTSGKPHALSHGVTAEIRT